MSFYSNHKKLVGGLVVFLIFILLMFSFSNKEKPVESINITETKWVFDVNEIIINDSVFGSLGSVFMDPRRVKIVVKKDPIDNKKMKIEIDVLDTQ